MDEGEPVVSIITSLYDGDEYIHDFLQNIVKQSIFQKCELIIIDANSPGEEHIVIRSFQNQHDNIVYERLNHDPGIYETWNHAIRKSKGKYITNANLDDGRLSTHIEECVNAMEKNSTISVVSTATYVINEHENFYEKNADSIQRWFMKGVPEFYCAKDMFAHKNGKIESRNIPHNSPVWKKSIHDEIGYFDEANFKHASDWEFWLRASTKGFYFYHIAKPLSVYRIVKNSHNRRSREIHTNIADKIIDTYYDKSQRLNGIFDFNTQFKGSYGKHRSGWSFVMNSLKPRGNNPHGLIFSSFIERDFGWAFSNELMKIMMFRGWVGIAHAPHEYPKFLADIVNQYPSKYVKDKRLRMVWGKCKGLFTLTEYLANEWRRLLPNVPVSVLKHPTEFTDVKFSMERFLLNQDRKIIQIGYWLRKMTAILRLEPRYDVQKAIIEIEIDKHIPHIAKLWNACVKNEMRESKFQLKFGPNDFGDNKRKFDNLCSKYKTQVIPRLSDYEYDVLLSENIVFFDFYDISASNLVVECIVRNTPILIKKHPATIEYLGEDYPFFFETIEEANLKATDMELINRTHLYMKTEIDVHKFTAESFISSFFTSKVYNQISNSK